MRTIFRSALAVAVLLAASGHCPAEAAKKTRGDLPEGLRPVLTVSFAGSQRLQNDLAWLGKLVQMPFPVEWLGRSILGGSDLEGIDKTRPWGFVLKTDASGDFLLREAFVPVTDLKKLLASLKPAIGMARETGGGVLEINAGRDRSRTCPIPGAGKPCRKCTRICRLPVLNVPARPATSTSHAPRRPRRAKNKSPCWPARSTRCWLGLL